MRLGRAYLYNADAIRWRVRIFSLLIIRQLNRCTCSRLSCLLKQKFILEVWVRRHTTGNHPTAMEQFFFFENQIDRLIRSRQSRKNYLDHYPPTYSSLAHSISYFLLKSSSPIFCGRCRAQKCFFDRTWTGGKNQSITISSSSS